MNFTRMIFACLICCLATSGIYAQGAKLKRASMYMESLNYVGAIDLYNQILEKDDVGEAKINLAECYRKVNDSENAEYWYGQVVRIPEAEPVHKLYYGQMLQRNGKCDLAKEWYEQYVDEVPDDLRGQYLVKACDYEDELMTKNAGIYEITHLDINSNLDDFSPAFYGDGIVFSSERDKGSAVKREHCWTGNPFLELHYVDADNTAAEGECGAYEFGKVEKFSDRLNSKFHDAAVTFSDDESQIFFTRNNVSEGKVGKSDDGIVKLKVFYATGSDGNWSKLEGLPFNSDEYSVAHPSLGPGGNMLYFSSDMPGGFGGMDLYVSEQEGGRWGPPINLGPSINTEGNEIFPSYHDERLYFSSDGQIGLGGLDIYYMQDLGEGEFGSIENIGYPLNTIDDDFGLVFNEDGTKGFFSSDRDGGNGRDDIYSFCKMAAPVEIYVYDADTEEPIEGATVINDCTGNTLTTGEDGRVTIDMKVPECCTFSASMEEYLDNEKEGCTETIGEKIFVEIPLSKETQFDLEGIVFDQSTGLPLEGAEVILENDCDKENPESLVTDASGRYYFKLEPDCCYKVKATKEGYFGNPVDNQCTKDLTEPTTLQTNLNLQPTSVSTTTDQVINNGTTTYPGETGTVTSSGPPTGIYKDGGTGLYMDSATGLPAEGTHNGTTYSKGTMEGGNVNDTYVPSGTVYSDGNLGYLLHIYYDFDQSYIRSESESELRKLCQMMNENPDLVVEIASHTDSRGSDSYNRRLSQRRAEAAVRWMCKNCGIERDRLIPRGYGETKNVNQCANSIPCSEQEHQMNRRTEFRVIGCKSCWDNPENTLSKPNENTQVDECQGCPF